MRYLKTSIISLVLIFISASAAFAGNWEQMPLRTKAQVAPGGEGMQHAWDLVFSPNHPATVYMLTDTSRLWKSNNFGDSWTPLLAQGFYSVGGVSLSVNKKGDIGLPVDNGEDVLFVAGNLPAADDVLMPSTLASNAKGHDGIYRSLNEGRNWDLVAKTAFFSPISEGVLAKGTPGERTSYVSAQGGARFAVDSGSTPKTIYAGTSTQGILISQDGGGTWLPASWGQSLIEYDIQDIKILPQTRKMLIIGWQWATTGKVNSTGATDTTDGRWIWKLDDTTDEPVLKMFIKNLDDNNAPVQVQLDQNDLNPDHLAPQNFHPRSFQVNPCDVANSVYVALGTYGVGKLAFSANSAIVEILNTGLPQRATDGLGPIINKRRDGAAVSSLSVSDECVSGNPYQMYVSFYRLFGEPMTPYRSTDGGHHWGSTSVSVNVLFDLGLPDHGSMYRGGIITQVPNSHDTLTEGGVVLKSINGNPWQYSNTGYTGGRVGGGATNAFSFQSATDFTIFLTDWGVLTSTNGIFDSPVCPRSTGGGSDPFCTQAGDSQIGAANTGDVINNSIVIAYSDELAFSATKNIPDSYKMTGIKGKFKFVKFVSETKFYADNYEVDIDANGNLTKTLLPDPVVGIDKDKTLYAASLVNNHLEISYKKSTGTSWIDLSGSSPFYSSIDQIVVSNDGTTMYVANSTNQTPYFRGVSKFTISTENNTVSWTQPAQPQLNDEAWNFILSHALVVNSRDGKANEVCVGAYAPRGHSNGVFCTHDFVNWVRAGTEGDLISHTAIYGLSENPYNHDVYVGTSYGTWIMPGGFMDSDNDGTSDIIDIDPVAPGDDVDQDGVTNGADNCPYIANADQLNWGAADAQGDVCDTDDDNDGARDFDDAFPFNPAESLDTDGDGIGNNADADDDNDTVSDLSDNCPLNINLDQLNTDGDLYGDACDTDDDNDTKLDVNDNCPLISNLDQANIDGDSLGDVCDSDNDNDGLTDAEEATLYTDPLNRFDPSLIAAGPSLLLGIQKVPPQSLPVVYAWNNQGVFIGSGVVDATTVDIDTGGGDIFSTLNAGGVEAFIYGYQLTFVAGIKGIKLAEHGNYDCVLTSKPGVVCEDGSINQPLTSPVEIVPTLRNPRDVASGSNFSCAINGTNIVCWGDGVGAGHLISKNPVSLPVLAIATGNDHLCAINDDRTVSCWGLNTLGQLGVDADANGKVDGISNALRITAGANHTCVVTGNYSTPSSLSVSCWGNPTATGSVPSLYRPVNIRAGGDQTCAVQAKGLSQPAESAMTCWPQDIDTDGDGIGNSTDADDDADGVSDVQESINNTNSLDTDNDGVVNSIDTDDDGDGMSDECEFKFGMDTLLDLQSPDIDGDGISNITECSRDSNPTTIVSLKNDYNDDGLAEWMWKDTNISTFDLSYTWQLLLPIPESNVDEIFDTLMQLGDQTNWDIVTTGDFDYDGDADILWRHATSGAWKITKIQNRIRVSETQVQNDFDSAHLWSVVGAGDTDKDGDDDIILKNGITGDVMVWEVQNGQIDSSWGLGFKSGYTLSRIGDFNNDGDVDLLFRQVNGDGLVIWEIEDNVFAAEHAFPDTGPSNNAGVWSPMCTGDYDGDGDDDIMLLGSPTPALTNQVKWFVVENYARVGQKFSGQNSGFTFLACGQYDADHDADVLWQRDVDGQIRVIVQQGYRAVFTTPGSPDAGFIYRGNSN